VFTESTDIKLPGHIEFTLTLISKDAFLELDTTQTFLRDVLCPVRGRNEYLWQMTELFETNACKLSRTMIFLTDDQNGLFAHVKHSGKAITKTKQI
jgi:hypothetical protein